VYTDEKLGISFYYLPEVFEVDAERTREGKLVAWEFIKRDRHLGTLVAESYGAPWSGGEKRFLQRVAEFRKKLEGQESIRVSRKRSSISAVSEECCSNMSWRSMEVDFSIRAGISISRTYAILSISIAAQKVTTSRRTCGRSTSALCNRPILPLQGIDSSDSGIV